MDGFSRTLFEYHQLQANQELLGLHDIHPVTVDPPILASQPSRITRRKPKRKQVKNACIHCQKACKRCDDGRACKRCIRLGLDATCVDSPRKPRVKGVKRGPYKKRQEDQDLLGRGVEEHQFDWLDPTFKIDNETNCQQKFLPFLFSDEFYCQQTSLGPSSVASTIPTCSTSELLSIADEQKNIPYTAVDSTLLFLLAHIPPATAGTNPY